MESGQECFLQHCEGGVMGCTASPLAHSVTTDDSAAKLPSDDDAYCSAEEDIYSRASPTNSGSHSESSKTGLDSDVPRPGRGGRGAVGKIEYGKNEFTLKKVLNRWTAEEHKLLQRLIKKYGTEKNWSTIAIHIPGRSGKQCRERWLNHLKEGIIKGNWTPEEEFNLALCHSLVGSQWTKIAKRLPGRTENAIKNLWNATYRSKIPTKRCGVLWTYISCTKIHPDHSKAFTTAVQLLQQSNELPQNVQQKVSSAPDGTNYQELFKQDMAVLCSEDMLADEPSTAEDILPSGASALDVGCESSNPAVPALPQPQSASVLEHPTAAVAVPTQPKRRGRPPGSSRKKQQQLMDVDTAATAVLGQEISHASLHALHHTVNNLVLPSPTAGGPGSPPAAVGSNSQDCPAGSPCSLSRRRLKRKRSDANSWASLDLLPSSGGGCGSAGHGNNHHGVPPTLQKLRPDGRPPLRHSLSSVELCELDDMRAQQWPNGNVLGKPNGPPGQLLPLGQRLTTARSVPLPGAGCTPHAGCMHGVLRHENCLCPPDKPQAQPVVLPLPIELQGRLPPGYNIYTCGCENCRRELLAVARMVIPPESNAVDESAHAASCNPDDSSMPPLESCMKLEMNGSADIMVPGNDPLQSMSGHSDLDINALLQQFGVHSSSPRASCPLPRYASTPCLADWRGAADIADFDAALDVDAAQCRVSRTMSFSDVSALDASRPAPVMHPSAAAAAPGGELPPTPTGCCPPGTPAVPASPSRPAADAVDTILEDLEQDLLLGDLLGDGDVAFGGSSDRLEDMLGPVSSPDGSSTRPMAVSTPVLPGDSVCLKMQDTNSCTTLNSSINSSSLVMEHSLRHRLQTPSSPGIAASRLNGMSGADISVPEGLAAMMNVDRSRSQECDVRVAKPPYDMIRNLHNTQGLHRSYSLPVLPKYNSVQYKHEVISMNEIDQGHMGGLPGYCSRPPRHVVEHLHTSRMGHHLQPSLAGAHQQHLLGAPVLLTGPVACGEEVGHGLCPSAADGGSKPLFTIERMHSMQDNHARNTCMHYMLAC